MLWGHGDAQELPCCQTEWCGVLLHPPAATPIPTDLLSWRGVGSDTSGHQWPGCVGLWGGGGGCAVAMGCCAVAVGCCAHLLRAKELERGVSPLDPQGSTYGVPCTGWLRLHPQAGAGGEAPEAAGAPGWAVGSRCRSLTSTMM